MYTITVVDFSIFMITALCSDTTINKLRIDWMGAFL